MKLTNKALAEFIGTFTLVLGGCGTAVFAGGSVGFLGVSLAFGLTVVAMAYGVGHISGAHLNPAVSLGVLVNGRMTVKEFMVYVVSQILVSPLAHALHLPSLKDNVMRNCQCQIFHYSMGRRP